jgi:hypothetical protein
MLGYLDPETAAKRKTCKFNNWQVWPKLRSYCWQGSKWGEHGSTASNGVCMPWTRICNWQNLSFADKKK